MTIAGLEDQTMIPITVHPGMTMRAHLLVDLELEEGMAAGTVAEEEGDSEVVEVDREVEGMEGVAMVDVTTTTSDRSIAGLSRRDVGGVKKSVHGVPRTPIKVSHNGTDSRSLEPRYIACAVAHRTGSTDRPAGAGSPYPDQGDGEEGEEEEVDPMAAMMGFGGFGSTKVCQVVGKDEGR